MERSQSVTYVIQVFELIMIAKNVHMTTQVTAEEILSLEVSNWGRKSENDFSESSCGHVRYPKSARFCFYQSQIYVQFQNLRLEI